MSLEPYYDDGQVVIYHGDCREIVAWLDGDVLISDPPYGIAYQSSMTGHNGGTSLPGIAGDDDTSLRDWVLAEWGDRPWAVFGSWRRPRPGGTKTLLVWDKGDHVGMGDLSIPWKPNTEEVYVGGAGWSGHRGSSVLRYPAPVSWNSVGHGRKHAHEKPVNLMRELVEKAPPGLVVDPFMGSGPVAQACHEMGRRYIGIEIVEEYCEIAVRRLGQLTLDLESSA